jgi:hypothetical protein
VDGDEGARSSGLWTRILQADPARELPFPLTATAVAPSVQGCDRAPVPAGTYAVYVASDVLSPEQSLLDVAGPWSVDLLPEAPAVTGLPADFPVADVPLPGGRLVVAAREGDGWVVEVALAGDDRVVRAVALLAGATEPTGLAGRSGTGTITSARGAWEVEVTASTTGGGEESLVYRLTPA